MKTTFELYFFLSFLVPYLYPFTNTIMTSSIYMTAAVAVNRYLDVMDVVGRPRIRSGYVQALLVLSLATIVNVPK